MISKTRFQDGVQCTRRLWYELHDPLPPAPFTQYLFAQAADVLAAAAAQHPDAVVIDAPTFSDALRDTEAALRGGASTVVGACFAAHGLAVRTDLLHRLPDGWHLVEVKASTRVKPEHLADVAFQWFALERAGVVVREASLQLINTACCWPDAARLFHRHKVTDEALRLLPAVAQTTSLLRAVAAYEEAPDEPIGRRCTTPVACPYRERCWADVPRHNVFTIPRHRGRADAWYHAGKPHVLDLTPEDCATLTPTQRRYVEAVRAGEPDIDREAIKQALGALEYPLHFLDFETLGPAVPWFDGMRPYESFPFQYSLHIEYADGTLTHCGYLHAEPTDPRPAVARHLAADLEAHGSVVVYNAATEQRGLDVLADAAPTHAANLLGARDRLWDLLPVIRAGVVHPEACGSTSLKQVWPALTGARGYDGLTLADGRSAQVEWVRMVRDVGVELSALHHALVAYCHADTRALHEVLAALSDALGPGY